jgi:formylglycine-generating enzyme required for sulfatase activity
MIALLGILLLLPAITAGYAASEAPRGELLVALEIESRENTLDGCTACGCRAKGELEPGEARAWWITFGLVKPDAQKGWETVAPSSHCGSGSFQNTAADFRRTVGHPYVILDLSTTVVVLPTGDINLETRVSIEKLTGFDQNGQPLYATNMQKRMLSLAEEGDLMLALLVADPREKAAFGIHEVLLGLQANVLELEPASSYGMISVSADVPGAQVLLDGGLAGRIAEGRPVLLKNVLTGERQIRVRDFSGREASRQIVVEKDRTVEVVLNVLRRSDLVPIGKNPQGHEEYWRVKDGAMMVRVPAGEFLMGSPPGEGEPHERPQHRVDLSEFLIDKTEVTWRQFRKFTAAKGTELPRIPIWGTPDDYPAAFILWEEAQEYCQWAGGRLPTEAEWEKAARGTDGRKYPWGNEWDPQRCNSISGGPHRPESVGSFPNCVSPYGVLDMSGSMWEWCADRYGESYYAEGVSRDPEGPTSGRLHVMRGGAWMSQPIWLRAAYRFKASPTSRNADHGFRCAREAPE